MVISRTLTSRSCKQKRLEAKIQTSNSRILKSEVKHLGRKKKVPLPNQSVFELNQVSTGEDDEEFQVLEPVRMETKPKNQLVSMGGGEEQLNDLNLPVCRDIGNGSSQPRKRKITWSDQVSLRG
ncbi:hypothetical protein NE237_010623 [Protea cynaroides]|uniref:Uncharacterized protein n=1 Tax=Protea cynaroides TaxID=273540 RepID=A0A9Q0R1F7_9MAGN|nr:hypothetical protein NE237_010623 [Protea cynaroides]